MDCFLMMGQSNMAGRGEIGAVPPISDPRLFMLRNGRWQKLSEPVNPDRGIFEGKFRSGISLAASFALAYANATGQDVGLIPCADGGTYLDLWMPGEILFENAVVQTRFAMKTATLKGLLWHQGETDVRLYPERIDSYPKNFETIRSSLMEALGVSSLPTVIGHLGDYLFQRSKYAAAPQLNAIFDRIAAESDGTIAVASADGLTCRPDLLHFDAPSCRIFGERYFEAYTRMIHQDND